MQFASADGMQGSLRSGYKSTQFSGRKFDTHSLLNGGFMNFLSKLLRGMAFVPAAVQGIEGLFGSRSGLEKKEAALSFVSAALSFSEAVAAKDIADEAKFRDGLSKVIDGTVQCLNASVWMKKVT
ncbi:MAG TPA: hypothetical protein VEV41_24895 [Terriglobales bacterium]|nr:hypothetical protein [Terriglobales bacterium]